MFTTTRLFGGGNNGDDDAQQQSAKDFLLKEQQLLKEEVRMFLMCSPPTESRSLFGSGREKRELVKQLQISPFIPLPHLIVNSTSVLQKFFVESAESIIQFNQIKVQVESVPSSSTTTSSTTSTNIVHTFSSNQELSKFLNELAVGSIVMLTGHLCGDLADEVKKTFINLCFSFKGTIQKNELNPLDYIDTLCKLLHYDGESEADHQLSTRASLPGKSEYVRPWSFESWFGEREMKNFIKEQPDFADDWRKAQKWKELRLDQLTEAEKAELQLQYDAVIAKCDAHDLIVKQRWLTIAQQSSPDINAILLEIDNSSIKITADLKVTSSLTCPLIGTFWENTSIYTGKQTVVNFKVETTVSTEMLNEEIDVKNAFNYNGITAGHHWGRPQSDDPRSDFLRNFGDTALILSRGLTLTWHIASYGNELNFVLALQLKGEYPILPTVTLKHLVYLAQIPRRNNSAQSFSGALEFSLQFTWKLDEAPPILLQYQADAESYIFLADPITKLESDGVQRWAVKKGPFRGQLIFRKRPLTNGEFHNEVSLFVQCQSPEPEHAIEPQFRIHPGVAIPVFDQFLQYDEDILKQLEKPKSTSAIQTQSSATSETDIDSSANNNSANDDDDEKKKKQQVFRESHSLVALLKCHYPHLVLDESKCAVIAPHIRMDKIPRTYRTTIHLPVFMGDLKGTLSWGGFDNRGLHVELTGETIGHNENNDVEKKREEQLKKEKGKEKVKEKDEDDHEEDEEEDKIQHLPSMTQQIAVPAPELTLTQVLTAANLSSLLSHFPSVLLDNVRLRGCSMRVTNPEDLSHCELLIYGTTGAANSDHFMVIHGTTLIRYDYKTEHREWAPITLVKLYDSNVIVAKHIPGLQQFRNMKTSSSFVYLAAEAGVGLKASSHLNYSLTHCHWAGSIPDVTNFPEDTVILHGAHFLTIKQQKQLVWTSVADAMIPLEISTKKSQKVKQSGVSTSDLRNSGPLFDIPGALLHSPLSSSHFAQYVFSWLDVNSLLFGLRFVNQAAYTSQLLTDNQWWKQKLAHDYGAHVVRWSDTVLTQWRLNWLNSKPVLRAYESTKRKPASQTVIDSVISKSLWFTAAIHLQTRLNAFSKGILKQRIPQFPSHLKHHKDEENENEEDDSISASHTLVRRNRNGFSIPIGIELMLLATPPFQNTMSFMKPHYDFWNRSTDMRFALAKGHKDLYWFAYRDAEEATRYFAIYSGSCYIIADEKTAHLGIPVGETTDQQNQDQDEDQDEQEVEVEDEAQNGEDGEDAETSLITKSSISSQIREVCFNDSNNFPILEWEAYQSGFFMVGRNSFDFCHNRGVFPYINKVHKMWDTRAAAITNPIESSSSTVTILPDEDDLQRETELEEEEQEEEDQRNRKLNKNPVRGGYVDAWGHRPPAPLTAANANFDFNRACPPIKIKFDNSRMRSLIGCQLQQEIAEDE